MGLGGGSIIQTLRKNFNYKNNITAIELDKVIVAIAKNEFKITNTKNTSIICKDAIEFLKTNTQKFDFIIIDLFIDNKVPQQFLESHFWKLIINKNPKSILFNASLNLNNNTQLKIIKKQLKKNTFKVTLYDKVEKTNTLLIAKSYI